jgi:predicted TIM-barrel fold metal-dependent hydrolase
MSKNGNGQAKGEPKAGEKVVIVSCDTHIGPRLREDLRQYCPKEFLEDYDAFVTAWEETSAYRDDAPLGTTGHYDVYRRLADLDQDGVAGEVIFHGSQNAHPIPFIMSDPSAGAATMTRHYEVDYEHAAVGRHMYNQWLADFVSLHPGRHAGIAVITVHDLDETVRQVTWAKEHDLRGVLLPAGVGTLPFYNHPRYEPLWSVCADLNMPLHTHVGSAVPDYGDLPGANALFAMESTFFSHRPFWFLIWGGVFESHPDLTMVFAEQGSDWVPDTLQMMDNMYGYMFRHEQKRLKSRPSEYWQRQCFVQAMFFRASEAKLRHKIGIENMLWGSDYPHYEGSWPNSRKVIHEALHGAPEPEIRAILGENAARLYGFDLAMLDQVAANVGPTLDEI